MGFLGLIENTLDAICIVNPHTKEIMFSNKKYDVLSDKFSLHFQKDSAKSKSEKSPFNLLQ